MTAIASAYIVCKLLSFFECSDFFKVCKNYLSCFHSSHTCIFSAVKNLRLVLGKLSFSFQLVILFNILCTCKVTVICKATNHRKITALTNLKVVRVMSRSNLNNTCTLFHICVFVTYNRNFLVEQRKNYMTTVQMFVTLVILVDCNGSIAKHCFGTCCCNFKIFACFLNLIKQMPEMAVLLLVFNLSIGN